MALDSNSTLADAYAQFNDNLSWEGDIARARNCLAAVRWIIGNRPIFVADDVKRINFDSMERMQERLESYLAVHGTAVGRCSFTEGRMVL